MSASTASAGDRVEIGGESWAVVRVLKADAFALTRLVRRGDALAVHKRSRLHPLLWIVGGRLFARWLHRREVRLYRRLEGIPGVPALLGTDGKDAYLHAWVPGITLDRYPGRVGDAFFPRLREILAAVHARGIAYVDLAKDENIVVSEPEGEPFLIDYQVCWDFSGRGGVRRRLGRRLQREDLYHLEKHVKRYRPDLAAALGLGAGPARRSLANRLHGALVKKPYNWVVRRVLRMPRGRPR